VGSSERDQKDLRNNSDNCKRSLFNKFSERQRRHGALLNTLPAFPQQQSGAIKELLDC
jgi:hypothetical protein